MLLRGMLIVALMSSALFAYAADEGRGGEIVGTWKVTGETLKPGTYTLQLDRDGSTKVEMHHKSDGGESNSNASGPNWTSASGKLKFNGSADVNGFKVKGTWTLTWDGPDAVTAKTEAGETFKLTRVKEKGEK